MGKPNGAELRQEQEARIAAETLKPYVDFGLPSPPALLFEDEPNASSFTVSRWDLLRPHWNGAVGMLKEGAGGYAALVLLHDRLKEHVARSKARLSEVQGTQRRYEALVRFLSSEATSFGVQTTLRESLGDSPPNVLDLDTAESPTKRWQWCSGPSFTVPPASEASGDLWPDYILMPTTRADSEDPHFRSPSFAAGLTWDEAIDKLDSRVATWTDVLVEAQLQHEVVEFRSRVVEHVLREFELLGYVDELGATPEDGRYFRLTKRQAKLVLEIESIRTNPEFEFKSRNQLFEKLAEQLQAWEHRTLINEARSIGIYRTYEGTNLDVGNRRAELDATFEAAAALVPQARRESLIPVGS